MHPSYIHFLNNFLLILLSKTGGECDASEDEEHYTKGKRLKVRLVH